MALLFCAAGIHHAAAAPSYQTIYQFTDGSSGCLPNAGLTAGRHGEFYGVTSLCGNRNAYGGTVFMLTPPAASDTKWHETTLWRFHGPEGEEPDGTLLVGRDGALYGTTYGGPNNRTLFGSVFKLAPPGAQGGAWTYAQIWHFGIGNAGRDGVEPTSGLVADETGALYGSTTFGGEGPNSNGAGTVFKLTPPAPAGQGAWAFEKLSSFGAKPRAGSTPFSTLYRDANGVLYGTDSFGGLSGYGTVFSVTPPAPGQTKWTTQELYEFQAPNATPFSGLVPGPDGALYGMTSGYEARDAGTIFRVAPPANGSSHWTGQTLYQFSGLDGVMPIGNLTPDRHGGFYGTTFLGGSYNQGTVFHVQPNADGHLPWALTKLHTFKFLLTGTQNIQPNGGLVMDAYGALLGTTFQDLRYFAGSVFRLVP